MPPVWYSVMRVVTLVQARLAKNGFFFGHLFFQYNKRLLRQKTGEACLYMLYAPEWSLPSQF